jgi:hypothetical protein
LKSRASSAGSDEDRAKAVDIAAIVAAYPSQAQADTDAGLRAAAYFEALVDLPAWAVAEARRLIAKGRTDYGKPWAPTPSQLAELVDLIVEPVRRDLATVTALLAAKSIGEAGPDERSRVESGFAKLKLELAGRAGG